MDVGQDADFSDGYDLQSWGHVGSELGEGQHDELEGMRPVGRGRPLRSCLDRPVRDRGCPRCPSVSSETHCSHWMYLAWTGGPAHLLLIFTSKILA